MSDVSTDVIVERLDQVIKSVDLTNSKLDRVAEVVNEVPGLKERLTNLENWHTWMLRSVLFAFIAAATAGGWAVGTGVR